MGVCLLFSVCVLCGFDLGRGVVLLVWLNVVYRCLFWVFGFSYVV